MTWRQLSSSGASPLRANQRLHDDSEMRVSTLSKAHAMCRARDRAFAAAAQGAKEATVVKA